MRSAVTMIALLILAAAPGAPADAQSSGQRAAGDPRSQGVRDLGPAQPSLSTQAGPGRGLSRGYGPAGRHTDAAYLPGQGPLGPAAGGRRPVHRPRHHHALAIRRSPPRPDCELGLHGCETRNGDRRGSF